jgi:hypothetical protein
MNTVANGQYSVLVTHLPASEPNGQPWRWRATLLGFPDIAEEALSRDQVLQQIQKRIADLFRHSEIVTLPLPSSSPAVTEDEVALQAQGWDDHGLFKDDPEVLQLFDEIEAERNQHLVGNE